jgi:hypothetical protein
MALAAKVANGEQVEKKKVLQGFLVKTADVSSYCKKRGRGLNQKHKWVRFRLGRTHSALEWSGRQPYRCDVDPPG